MKRLKDGEQKTPKKQGKDREDGMPRTPKKE